MKKRPTDPFQLAKLIGDIATKQVKDEESKPVKNAKKKTSDKSSKT